MIKGVKKINPDKAFSVRYKKLKEDTMLMKPAIKEPNGNSLGIYYSVSESISFVSKCYDRKTFKPTAELENCFLLLAGHSAKAILSNKHRYYMAPYCNSGNLLDLINKKVKFTNEQIKSFIEQISNQLSEIHEVGLYHGELTPDHILLDIDTNRSEEITFKICGFGHYEIKPKEYYRTPYMMNYLDPRIVSDPSKEYDCSCDIWSLGVIIYQLATGGLPDNMGGQMDDISDNYVLPDDDSSSTLLSHLISKCVSCNPKERMLAKNIPYHPFFIPIRKDTKNYVLTKELGKGKFGTVYLTHLSNDKSKKYATKVLNPLNNIDNKGRMLILGEITILLMMKNCPYIVKLHDYFEYQEKVHLVLEYFNGGDLEVYLTNIKKPSNKPLLELAMIEEIKAISYNLGSAINSLHSKNIIHRDIKPMNLLISLDNDTKRLASVKLTDFGTSRELFNPEAETMVGTPKYMAPDVFMGGYNLKTDVWSYGCVLYYLAYGILPSDFSGVPSITNPVKYPPKPLYLLHDSFINLIKCCLQTDQEKRPTMSQIMTHPYFVSSPCIKIYSIPQFYNIENDKTIFKGTNYATFRITYTPTNAKLLMKIIEGPIDESTQQTIIRNVNNLISLRGCSDIYKLHQSFVMSETYYFVLDYTDGETLEQYIMKKGTMAPEIIKRFSFSLITGIFDIHARKFQLESLSPSTIYICPGNSPKDLPKIKIAGFAPIIQGLGPPPVPSTPKDEIYAFGEIMYLLLFGTTKGYENVSASDASKLKSSKLNKAFDLMLKCAEKSYMLPNQVLSDNYFEQIGRAHV